MAETKIKCVIVGDDGVGKTSLQISWLSGACPEDYVPTIADNGTGCVKVDGNDVNMELWDTAGGDDYNRLRPLTYPKSDVFLRCFSSTSTSSLQSVKTKWQPEIVHFCPGVPFLLVGTKSNLNEPSNEPTNEELNDQSNDQSNEPTKEPSNEPSNEPSKEALKDASKEPANDPSNVCTEAAQALSEEIGAHAFLQCSAKKQDDVQKVFEEAARIGIKYQHSKQKPKSEQKSQFCTVL